MSSKKLEGSARERLLAAANELFYEEGVHTVGIDRVIERAGVAKASLYSTFGSKDELVRAYLLQRAEARRKRISDRIARHTDPRDRILSIFDLLGELAPIRRSAAARSSTPAPRARASTAAPRCASTSGRGSTGSSPLSPASSAAPIPTGSAASSCCSTTADRWGRRWIATRAPHATRAMPRICC